MSVGAFTWYDLATSDPAAASAFYAGVVGWTAVPLDDKAYTLLKMADAALAGVHRMPDEVAARGIPPHWSGHVEVADVDASVAQAVAGGAALRWGPSDIPDVGRFAVIADPAGAHLYLFTPSYEDHPPAPMSPGSVAWHELHTPDPAAALAFYQTQFGWQESRAFDMDLMGVYQLFAYDGSDRGGVMATGAGMTPHWLFYIAVEAIDAAAARVMAGGGRVVHGPHEAPGGVWTLVGQDPQGGHFALVAPRR